MCPKRAPKSQLGHPRMVLSPPSPKIDPATPVVTANYSSAGIGCRVTQEEAAKPPTIWVARLCLSR
jgi:hypothetical protein